MPKPIVSYLRVSTREQRRSGLGLDAQREAIARFAEAEGFEAAAEFVEIETGKGADALERRPQLVAALAEGGEVAWAGGRSGCHRPARGLRARPHAWPDSGRIRAGRQGRRRDRRAFRVAP